jgi:hypothetical protein
MMAAACSTLVSVKISFLIHPFPLTFRIKCHVCAALQVLSSRFVHIIHTLFTAPGGAGGELSEPLANADVKPAVNQVRVHIGHTPIEVLEYCKENGILVMAFSPNAIGKLLSHPVVTEMANKYAVTVPQLCIRYDLQLGVLPLPKTIHKEYMTQNADVDFIIAEEDMNDILSVAEVSSL